ncbi:MAG: hypothetical protein ABI306_02295 [Caulobacteraceae bacterium]
MKTLYAILPAAILALAGAAATPAAAQTVGSYTGTAADGSGLQFTVATDTVTGKPEITGVSLGFSDACGDHTTFNSGWGFGVNQDVIGHRIRFVSTYNYFTFHVSLVFSADGSSATGTIASIVPSLSPVGPDPERSTFCSKGSQSLGLMYVPGSARVNPSAFPVITGKVGVKAY